jgi:hypothetical protein
MNSEPRNFVCPPFDDGRFGSRDLERWRSGITWVKLGVRSVLDRNGYIIAQEYATSAPSAPPRELSLNPQ